MEKHNSNLSFLKIKDQRTPFASRILHVGYIESHNSSRSGYHAHEFWQLELIKQGPVTAQFDGITHRLESGHRLFLPPGIYHQFDYPDSSISWCSIKFEVIGDIGGIRSFPAQGKPSTVLQAFWDSFEKLLEDETQDWVLAELEALLQALMVEAYFPTHPPKSTAKGVMPKVERLLADKPSRRWTGKEVADELGYTPEYLSTIYKQQAGRPLKSYLDEKLISVIRDQLRFADMPIQELAEHLGFPDAFTFSKFVKRVTGMTPASLRKAHLPNTTIARN